MNDCGKWNHKNITTNDHKFDAKSEGFNDVYFYL